MSLFYMQRRQAPSLYKEELAEGGTHDYTNLHRSQRLDCSFPEWFEKALRHQQQALNLIWARAGKEGLDPDALLSSVQRRGLPPLYREERHSLLCTEKESASSL